MVRCPSARRLLLLLLLHAQRVVTRCVRPNTDDVGEDGVAEGADGDDDGGKSVCVRVSTADAAAPCVRL